MDGRIHFQLVKFCLHLKFQYLLRCLLPQITRGACEALEDSAVVALLDHGGWQRPNDPLTDQPPHYTVAKTILTLQHKLGGLVSPPWPM
jgi:hypothetical protein